MFDFTGYGENILTFKTEDENLKGYPVKVVSDSCVAKAESGDAFCGIATGVRCGAATVLMGGYTELPYSGDTAPTHGNITLSADGNGGVLVSEKGIPVTVISVDTEAATVGFIF